MSRCPGVYQVDPAECEQRVTDAIAVGYRSIDTAQAYHNEEGRGQRRPQVRPAPGGFLPHHQGVDLQRRVREAKASIDESLAKLQTDYIDLLLIHQPFNDYYGTWRAMEEAYKAGKLRAIGVSNFYPDRLIDLCQFSEIKPMVNQVETHALFQQAAAHEVMAKYGVVHESWGPFAEGRKDFFTNPTLQAIGAKYSKSVAQTALRFLIQSDVVVIPKSTHKERMAENLDVFDFQLSQEDMVAIRALDDGQSAFFSHSRPGHGGVPHQPGPVTNLKSISPAPCWGAKILR